MVYDQLEAACLPLMTAYQEDLTRIDRECIEQRSGTPFLHFTRAMGTHVAFMPPADEYPAVGVRVPYLFATADRWHIIKEVVSMAEYFTNQYHSECLLAHHFDGKRLRVVTVSQAVQIAKDYRVRIESQWRKRVADDWSVA